LVDHLEALIQDVRFSIRLVLRERAFTATVLVTLAVSIGLTSTVFMLVDVLLLRALPVSSPENLFNISAPGRNVDRNPSHYSHEFYERLRTSRPLFRNLLASSTTVSSGVNLSDRAVTDRVRCELVSGNYFDVLGVGAAAGRILSPEDDQTPGARPVLVLSYAFWQRRFAGTPQVVGRTVSVNGTPFTVVGVARRGFFGTRPGFGPDIWAPLMMVQPASGSGISALGSTQNYLEMIVRLEPHVDVRQAEVMATTVFANWLSEGAWSQPQGVQAPALHLTPAREGHSLLRAQYSQPLELLSAAVLLLLLIACANIATLLLSCATARAREFAVRTAIGATRHRCVRQLMTESVFIAVVGGAGGWLVCVYFGRVMLPFSSSDSRGVAVFTRSPNLRVDIPGRVRKRPCVWSRTGRPVRSSSSSHVEKPLGKRAPDPARVLLARGAHYHPDRVDDLVGHGRWTIRANAAESSRCEDGLRP
jgi:predicted permease